MQKFAKIGIGANFGHFWHYANFSINFGIGEKIGIGANFDINFGIRALLALVPILALVWCKLRPGNWHWCQFWHWILALIPIFALVPILALDF